MEDCTREEIYNRWEKGRRRTFFDLNYSKKYIGIGGRIRHESPNMMLAEGDEEKITQELRELGVIDRDESSDEKKTCPSDVDIVISTLFDAWLSSVKQR